MNPLVRSKPFDPDVHDTVDFDCGVDDLNQWLAEYADHARKMGTANTYVWSQDEAVVGFYAMAAHAVVKNVLPTQLGRGSPLLIPGVIIGKLALATSLQGSGSGSALLLDALARASYASDEGPAARLIVVDAIDDAARQFYRAHGFIDAANNPLKLYMKMSSARQNVDLAIAGLAANVEPA